MSSVKKVVVGFVFLTLLLPSVLATDGDTWTWNIETVDSAVGTYSVSLAMDSNSNPHIAYIDNKTGDVKYARQSDGVWHIESLGQQLQTSASLALDSDGNPHIASTGPDVSYASKEGNLWEITKISAEHKPSIDYFDMESSLVLDSSDNPHILYIEDRYQPESFIMYATFENGSWSIKAIPVEHNVFSALFDIDSAGNPQIIYAIDNATGSFLRYLRYDGGNWQNQTLDETSTDSILIPLSILLDNEGHPHICYEERTFKNQPPINASDVSCISLNYTWFDGENWHPERIASGSFASMALDSKGQPAIAYFSFLDGSLRYTWLKENTWHYETINASEKNNTNDASWCRGIVSLVLDKSDNPHLCYIDFTDNSIKYVSGIHKASGLSLNSIVMFSSAGTIIISIAILVIRHRYGKQQKTAHEKELEEGIRDYDSESPKKL